MVAVASPVESDAVGERWAVDAVSGRWALRHAGNPNRVVVVTSSAARTAASVAAPLPVERAVAGPRVRLPASTYRRRRAVAAGLVIGLLLVVWAALGVFGGGPLLVPERPDPAGGRLSPGVTYVVQPGDTFWSIAVRLRPASDPRPLVDKLVATHGGATLHVGEQLRLPA